MEVLQGLQNLVVLLFLPILLLFLIFSEVFGVVRGEAEKCKGARQRKVVYIYRNLTSFGGEHMSVFELSTYGGLGKISP